MVDDLTSTYFRELAKHIVTKAGDDSNILRSLVGSVGLAHNHHTPGKYGLPDLLPSDAPATRICLTAINEFNREWRRRYPKWTIDPGANDQGCHIQALFEQLGPAVKTRLKEIKNSQALTETERSKNPEF